jgi:hypothetical protein
MTRQELYELVWREPVTHAAKRFGISDVALRKTCVRHGIPTPPAGYWAKLAHGKAVPKVPLPPLPKGMSDWIRLEPKEKPEILHPAARELAAILRKTREDDVGLLHWNNLSTYYQTYSVSLSRVLVERAKAEREEIQRREKSRRDREQKRLEYLTRKASAYEAYCRLERLWTFLQPPLAPAQEGNARRIIRSLGQRLEVDRQQFMTSTLEGEVHDLGSFGEDDIGDAM